MLKGQIKHIISTVSVNKLKSTVSTGKGSIHSFYLKSKIPSILNKCININSKLYFKCYSNDINYIKSKLRVTVAALKDGAGLCYFIKNLYIQERQSNLKAHDVIEGREKKQNRALIYDWQPLNTCSIMTCGIVHRKVTLIAFATDSLRALLYCLNALLKESLLMSHWGSSNTQKSCGRLDATGDETFLCCLSWSFFLASSCCFFFFLLHAGFNRHGSSKTLKSAGRSVWRVCVCVSAITKTNCSSESSSRHLCNFLIITGLPEHTEIVKEGRRSNNFHPFTPKKTFKTQLRTHQLHISALLLCSAGKSFL